MQGGGPSRGEWRGRGGLLQGQRAGGWGGEGRTQGTGGARHPGQQPRVSAPPTALLPPTPRSLSRPFVLVQPPSLQRGTTECQVQGVNRQASLGGLLASPLPAPGSPVPHGTLALSKSRQSRKSFFMWPPPAAPSPPMGPGSCSSYPWSCTSTHMGYPEETPGSCLLQAL